MNNFPTQTNNSSLSNQEQCIHHLFEAAVRRSPDAVAVVFVDEQSASAHRIQKSLTYQELNNNSNQLAHYLKTLGVGPEVLVGICVERSLDMIVAVMGVLKAGGAYVPLDPEYPQERLAFMLEDSQVPVLLTQSHLVSSLPAQQAQIICLDTDWENISKQSECNLAPHTTADNLAYIIYTSGSTGKPKGVLLQHGGLCNLAIAQKPVFNVQQDSSVLQFASFSFDGSVFEIFLALATGAKLVIARREALLPGEPLVQLLRDYAITTVVLPPAALAVMPIAELPALQTLVVAGEACPPHLVERWARGRRFINGYGPTENTVCATAAICTEGTGPLPIGYPIANVEIYVLDSQMQPVAKGEVGELYVGGAGVARGYLNRPELTAERFIPNPFIEEQGTGNREQGIEDKKRDKVDKKEENSILHTPKLFTSHQSSVTSHQSPKLYKTGDLGRYLPDGSLEFIGRSDTQVKLRGYRIEVGEIESLLSQHPAIQQAAIAMREDVPGNKRLIAYVVPYQDKEYIAQEQALADEVYSQLSVPAEPTFNITGWHSSYTGLPIPAPEMREWVDRTVDRILDLQPQRVLEIGCGLGLLLFRLAPHSTQYLGVDFSAQAVSYLQQQLQQLAQPLPQVSVSHRTADNLAGIEAGTFDTVIINSVSQYFPDIDYMLRVIAAAVEVVKPQGKIFIGDVRSLSLLEAYHTSVQLDQAPDSLSKKQLLARVRSHIAQEEELVIAPAFFVALRQHLPQISRVQIQLKRGQQHNELTCFRYDVTLHIEDAAKATNPSRAIPWLDWQAENLTITSLRQHLQQQPEVLGLQRVPNRRLQTEAKTLEWLKSEAAPATVGEWRSHLQQQLPLGIDPEDFWALSQEFPYKVAISWSNSGTHEFYDVVFQHQEITATDEQYLTPDCELPIANYKLFANQPAQAKMSGKLGLQLRRYLKEKLPEYMVPSAFVVLDTMPLTPNGKVDRKALPVPDQIQPELAENFVAPRTPIEEVLAGIWAEVLGLARVGIHDDFLELGGHSLTAVQIVARIQSIYQIQLPVRSLFTNSTIAEIASQLEIDLPQASLDIQAIVPVPRHQNLPLSFVQEGLWFLMQLYPDNPFYNEAVTIRISEQVNVIALQTALNEVVRRHEAWRTTFSIVDGQPVQVIHPQLNLELPVIDLQHLPDSEREPEAIRLAAAVTNTPFDLSQLPLLRTMLVQLGEADYRLFLSLHHIIVDGVSLRYLLLQELNTLYQAFASGQPSPLPELTIQYADFAVWQRQWLETVGANGQSPLAEKLAYWKQQLAALPTLQLPTDRPRPAIQTYRGATQTFILDRELTTSLKTLSRQERVTLFMTLLSAFQILLSRYSGQEDVVVGSPIAGRNHSEIERLIGFFVNTLVLRTNLEGNPSYRELASRVRQVCLEAYAHQDLPFDQLVKVLQPERDLSYTPIFQVMFVLQNNLSEELDLPEKSLSFQPSEQPTQIAKFDLTLSMEEQDGELIGEWVYNTDLFDHATIGRMIEHFQTLLSGIVAAPESKIWELPLLALAEEKQLLVEWNQNEVTYPQDLCLHQLFEHQVQQTPDAVAVVFEHQELTYRELNQRANQLAHYLQKQGVAPEVLVGVCIERSLELIVAILGILKAGGAYLPLDPAYPQNRLAFMLEDAQVSLLLTQQQLLTLLPSQQAPVICLDSDWEKIATESRENPQSKVTPENLVYVIYTSGSTGKSKGVMVEHRNIVNAYLNWEKIYQLKTVSSHLQMASFSFDVFSGDLVRALCSGGKLVLCPHDLLLTPHELYRFMVQAQIDCAEFVPVILRNLISYLEKSGARLDFMRLLVCGSDSWYVKEYEKFRQFCSPQTRLINSFGLTETTIDSSYFESETKHLTVEQLVPIGRPFPNTQLYILDRYMQPVPIGVVGELYIGGASVTRGYLNRPELTAQKFVLNPSLNSKVKSQKSKLYKTGDLARYLPDGNIQFLGRIDYQVKVRGFRIELGEIETALGQHPAVHDAVVLAREDVPGDQRLVAYVVSHSQESDRLFDGPSLRRFLKHKLPDYMIPSSFVILNALPLTPNGKVDRKALPAPESTRSVAAEWIAPRTPIEETLVKIWSEVLGVKQVGIEDNFFELGGHSLTAVQIVARIRDICHVELPVRSLFITPTIAEIAPQLETDLPQANSDIQAIAPVSRHQHLPLSFVQEGLWLLMQLHPDNTSYNEPMTIRISEQVNVVALQTALNEVVRRHEAWRTTFSTVDGQPVQVIHPQLNLELPVIDLQHLPDSERESESIRLATAATNTPFDLSQPPLLRTMLVQLGEADYRLFLVLHHIIFDGISLGNIFLQELHTLYKAFASGQPSPLPELTIQYADFAVWQRQWLETVGANGQSPLAEKLAYWKQQLAALPTLQLPTDRPRLPVASFRGGLESITFSQDLTAALKALCKREGVTPYMLLLAAFKTLLSHYSGQEDIVLGTVTAGHNHPQLQGVMGFFLNTLVLRTDLSGDPSFHELLQRVREVTLNAYAHQDLPFEKLVAELRPERHQNQHPLFQVAFIQEPSMEQIDPHWYFSNLEIQNGSSKFDLFVVVGEREECICEHIQYNADLFDAITIRRLIGHLQTLLAAVVANPDQKISDLPLLTAAEQEQLQQWNDTEFNYDHDVCLHQLFEAQAQKTPDAIAITFAGQELTYHELNSKANQLAHYLQDLGVKPEVLVGICVERSLEMAVGILGILKAGGAYVPLDPAYPQERLAFMLTDTQVPVLLTQECLVENLPPCPAQIVCLDRDWEKISASSSENLNSGVTVDNLAYVIYTSGSTGRPKGICLEQRPLLNLLAWHYSCLCSGARTLQFASLSFDASFHEMFAAWGTGGTLVVVSENLRADAVGLGQFLAAEKIEKVILPVVILQQLAESVGEDSTALLRPEMFAHLREITTTGEQLRVTPAIVQFFKYLPHCSFHNHYGPSETHVVTAMSLPNNPDTWLDHPPIGIPIANTQIYLVDKHFNPVPVGVPGELCIGGVSLARGYLHRPDLTAEKFINLPRQQSQIPNPITRIYRTGDLARYLPDGNIEYLGRIDQQVKIRGFRIELGEIEVALCKHPDVLEAVVIAKEDVTGDKRLAAYIVCPTYPDRLSYQTPCVVEFNRNLISGIHTQNISIGGVSLVDLPDSVLVNSCIRLCFQLPGTNKEQWLEGHVVWRSGQEAGIEFSLVSPEPDLLARSINYLLEAEGFFYIWQRTISSNLRNFLKAKLPNYMIPASFAIIDSIPLTPNGKVDKRSLPALERTKNSSVSATVLPRTPVEEALVEIWAEVLGVSQIGVHDNFLDLGGHSLLAAKINSRVRQKLQVDLPLRSMFEATTVAELAQEVEKHQGKSSEQPPQIVSVARQAQRMKLSDLKKGKSNNS